jgi:tRNA-binding EMAP/Myf-like protein
VSGLVKHITLDDFIGKYVLVLTNLKPAKMRGILSEGMVLCASTENELEVLSPPEGAKVGERLTVEGEDDPPDPQLVPKKKLWEKVRDGGVCFPLF